MLAQALYAQARFGDAGEQCALAAEEARRRRHRHRRSIWRGVRAKLLARAGTARPPRRSRARPWLVIEPTDLLTHRADALLDLAEVNSGKSAYQDVARAALSLYEQKGNAVGAARARALLGRP